jgi:hypothetical protein
VRYDELPPITRTEFTAAYRSTDSQERATSILRLALHDDDSAFIESACVELLGDEEVSVRRAATVAAGHLARLHGHVETETRDRLRSLAIDPEMSGTIADALDDIATFTRPKRPI